MQIFDSKRIILALMSLLITGCVKWAVIYKPEDLANVTNPKCVVIDEKISWYRRGGWPEHTLEIGLIPGIYKAEKEDDEGVFYRGPERPVFQGTDLNPGKYSIYKGGIWLPKTLNTNPLTYTYQEREVFSTDELSTHITRVTTNSINQGAGVAPSVGGAIIGGLIIEAIVSTGYGKILMSIDIEDSAFIEKISNTVDCPSELKGKE